MDKKSNTSARVGSTAEAKKIDTADIKSNIVLFIVSVVLFFVGTTFWFVCKNSPMHKNKSTVALKGAVIGAVLVFLIGFILGVLRIGR